MRQTNRPGNGLAIFHSDRFRVDGQIFHPLRRLDLREIRRGSDQAECGRFAGARFRDGSGQRRAVFVIVAAAVLAAVLKDQAARLLLQVIAIRRATRNHRPQCGSVICIRAIR